MRRFTLAVSSLAVLAACASRSTPVAPPAPAPVAVAPAPTPPPPPPAPEPPPPPKSLYDRLGGKDAIVAVIDDFVGRTTTDPRIKERFFNTDPVHLKAMLVDLVCMASGGPCQYQGKDMTTAHAGMELVDEEFTALVENLVASLDKFGVGAQEKAEILGALGPMKPMMVVGPDVLRPIDAAKLAEVTELAATLEAQAPAAAELLKMAVIAGQRGQRSYAEQLFARAELVVGPKPLAKLAPTFREGAPPVVETATKPAVADAAPQPRRAGNSDEDAPAPKRPRAKLTGTLQIDGKPVEGLGVVMLTPATGGRQRTPKVRVVEQRDKVFLPHVLAVPVGSTVQFPNYDPIYHNVFSLSKTKPFDLGLYKTGQMREVKFDKPGIVRLGCNIHAAMAGYVVVVDAPHYVVVDEQGSFAFQNLAPGTYKVRAWSERSGEPMTSELVIKPGTNERTIDLQAGVVPTIGPDKFGASRVSAAAGPTARH